MGFTPTAHLISVVLFTSSTIVGIALSRTAWRKSPGFALATTPILVFISVLTLAAFKAAALLIKRFTNIVIGNASQI
jgi:hypothetical protein